MVWAFCLVSQKIMRSYLNKKIKMDKRLSWTSLRSKCMALILLKQSVIFMEHTHV